jgi:hypothetical protein
MFQSLSPPRLPREILKRHKDVVAYRGCRRCNLPNALSSLTFGWPTNAFRRIENKSRECLPESCGRADPDYDGLRLAPTSDRDDCQPSKIVLDCPVSSTCAWPLTRKKGDMKPPGDQSEQYRRRPLTEQSGTPPQPHRTDPSSSLICIGAVTFLIRMNEVEKVHPPATAALETTAVRLYELDVPLDFRSDRNSIRHQKLEKSFGLSPSRATFGKR